MRVQRMLSCTGKGSCAEHLHGSLRTTAKALAVAARRCCPRLHCSRRPTVDDGRHLPPALATLPPAAAYLVLYVPPGTYTLLERLYIERSWMVLRGAGSGASTLHFPKSLRDVYGPNPEDERGFYVNEGALLVLACRLQRPTRQSELRRWPCRGDRPAPGRHARSPPAPRRSAQPSTRRPPIPHTHLAATAEAFLTLRGDGRVGKELAKVTGPAKRGDTRMTVSSAAGIKVGDYVKTLWTDVGGRFNDAMWVQGQGGAAISRR